MRYEPETTPIDRAELLATISSEEPEHEMMCAVFRDLDRAEAIVAQRKLLDEVADQLEELAARIKGASVAVKYGDCQHEVWEWNMMHPTPLRICTHCGMPEPP